MMEQNGRPEMQASPTCYCTKDAMHISLSWARGQVPDTPEKLEASKHFLRALGMENAMHLVYDHNDKSYSHIHIVASRVNPQTGRAYDDYQRLYKGLHAAIEYERNDLVLRKRAIPKNRQWCHDLAGAARDQEWDNLADMLFRNEATVKKTKLDLALAFGGHFGNHLEAHRAAFVRENDLVRLKKYQAGKVAAYTKKEIWHEENRVLGSAKRLHEQTGHGLSEASLKRAAQELTLKDDQSRALMHLGSDRGLALVEGPAGTGKSRMLIALRRACEYDRKQFRFLSNTNQVVHEAQKDGHTAATIASELYRLKFGNGAWNRNTYIAVDEASMQSHEQILELQRYAQQHGVAFRPIGNYRQLGSVERGGMHKIMVRRFGATHLTEVMRNPDPQQKKIWGQMHDRHWDKAVKGFRDAGAIHWQNTLPDSIKALTDDYEKDYKQNPKEGRLILAGSNIEVDELNLRVQAMRRQAGELGASTQLDTARGPLTFHVNDRIVMRESSQDVGEKRRGLVNGAFGYIKYFRTRADGKQEITVEIDRKDNQQRRVFTFAVGMDRANGDIADIRLGHASTVYSAQGRSIPQIYALHNPANSAPTNYVSLSRHTKPDGVRIYVPRETTTGYEDLAKQFNTGQDKTAAHSYMVHDDDRHRLEEPYRERPPREPDIPMKAPAKRKNLLDYFFDKVMPIERLLERSLDRGMER